MEIYHPVYSEPARVITVASDIIVDEYENEYVVYEWHNAEMAVIQGGLIGINRTRK